MAKKEKKSGKKDERGLAPGPQETRIEQKETENKATKELPNPGQRPPPTGKETAGMG